ncbi:MAG: MBL fold metallo-hydrolase [Pelagimonas sp.]|uniref:MBL fold metallo-hydrolase n=1 Tax=Pelagimonas sp. TaxID=2073170 RepID=UPI003D6C25D7
MKRRTFLKTFPAAAAALATTAGIVPIAVAADGHGAQIVAAQKFKVGEMVVTAISDGYFNLPLEMLNGVDAETIAALLTKGYQDPTNFRAAVNAYLVQSNGENYLIDAGTGAIFGPTLGDVASVLSVLGIQPADISKLIVTHLHGDHVGGAVKDGAALYPNAEMVVTQTEVDFWTSKDIRDQAPEQFRSFFDLASGVVGAYQDRLRLVTGEADLAPGLTGRPLPGHTLGHQGVMLESGGDSLLIWGDVVHVAPVQLARPEVTIGFDTDQELAAKTRADAFASVVQSGQKIAGMHMPFPGVGYVEKASEGFRFVPAPWDYM